MRAAVLQRSCLGGTLPLSKIDGTKYTVTQKNKVDIFLETLKKS